jgi:YfiH family protein
MIEEWSQASPRDAQHPGLPLLRSAVIPAAFRHGFTTRRGGVSRAPFDQLNLGMKWGDARESVLENRRRLVAVSGAERLYFANQVHGSEVVRVGAADSLAEIAARPADALCTTDPGLALAIFVADCVPILIADARTGACAAVHAGWRGTVAGVATATVQRMRADLGSRPEDLRVALGPSIGSCCFEVGEEVVEAVERAIPAARGAGAIRTDPAWPKAHVDLKRLNVLLLQAEGIAAAAIDAGPECTSCDRARFYSYRRDQRACGQHVGFIRSL